MILGIDTWSAYRVDWQRVRQEGIRFAFGRCTEAAGGVDPAYQRSVDGAREAGVYVGAYSPIHVQSDIDPQIGHMLRHMGDVGTRPGELPPALDLEVPWDWSSVGRATVWARIVRAVRMLTEHFGRAPVVYSSSGWWRDLGTGAAPEDAAAVAACPLWAAAYPYMRPWAPPEGGTTRPFGPWSKALIWQYSGDHSVPLPGVTSEACAQSGTPGHGLCQRVDRDVWLGTEAELCTLAQVTAPGIDAPPPTLPEGVGAVDPGEGIADWAVDAYRRERDG